MELLRAFTIDHWIGIASILVGAALSVSIYLLQQRISDKQRVDHRLQLEREIGKKLDSIRYEKTNSKIVLYNTKLTDRRGFAENKRSLTWGYPYHAAGLYGANFDGLEFVITIEEWDDQKYYRVGVIDYARILSVRAEGDGSSSSMILYVRPKLVQLDAFSIAYKKFRYYPVGDYGADSVRKPMNYIMRDGVLSFGRTLRYIFWVKWTLDRERKS